MKFIVTSAALLLSAAVSAASPAIEPIEANAQSSSVHMSATLASFDSFEWRAAPTYTRLANERRSALNDLRDGRSSVERAEELQKRADDVRSLLDRAKAACRQNGRAKCTGDSAAADRLLTQANAALAVISK